MRAQDRKAHRRESDRSTHEIRRVPPGTFRPGPHGAPRPDERREPERPALVMILAPLLGLSVWAAILFLLLA